MAAASSRYMVLSKTGPDNQTTHHQDEYQNTDRPSSYPSFERMNPLNVSRFHPQDAMLVGMPFREDRYAAAVYSQETPPPPRQRRTRHWTDEDEREERQDALLRAIWRQVEKITQQPKQQQSLWDLTSTLLIKIGMLVLITIFIYELFFLIRDQRKILSS